MLQSNIPHQKGLGEYYLTEKYALWSWSLIYVWFYIWVAVVWETNLWQVSLFLDPKSDVSKWAAANMGTEIYVYTCFEYG